MPSNNPTNIYYPGDGTVTDFTFTFPYLHRNHVKVTVDGVLVARELIAQNIARVFPAPLNGSTIRVYRETPKAPIVTWADGAVILGANLNASAKQALYIAEEAYGYAEGLAEEAKQFALAGVAEAVQEGLSGAAGELANAVADDLAAAENAKNLAEQAKDITVAAKGDVESTVDVIEAVATTVTGNIADAQALLASFRDFYLGTHAVAPTAGPNGGPIKEGALYFNSMQDKLKVYDGAAWQDAFFTVELPEEIAAGTIKNDSAVTGATVKDALNTLHSGKSDNAHGHAIGDVTALQSALDDKVSVAAFNAHGHGIAGVSGLEAALAGKATSAHSHGITDVTGLQGALDAKVPTTRTVSTNGLATGGGDLSANRTVTVPKAVGADLRTGTDDAKALTSKAAYDAANIVTLVDAGTIAVDFGAGQNFTVTLGGNRTLGNPTGAKVGQSGTIYIVQDATGGRTLALSGNWKVAGGTAPSTTTVANAVDSLHYKVRSATFIEVSLNKDVK